MIGKSLNLLIYITVTLGRIDIVTILHKISDPFKNFIIKPKNFSFEILIQLNFNPLAITRAEILWEAN